MSRILLADDSPNAQRMGEWILREEGYEVVSVTDGETALIRLADVSPDVVLADVFLPHVSGYELCREIKSRPELRHARVVLLAGMLERVDEAEAARVKADGILRKPFEASVVAATLRPLAEAATAERESALPVTPVAPAVKAKAPEPEPEPAAEVKAEAAPAAPPDPEIVRAAVTIALDLAMPAMIDELTERVMAAMAKRG